MYKVIYNNVIIDLLESVRYVKYIPANKRVIATDKSSANCIIASNLKDRYLLKGVPIPEGCSYLQVELVPITSEEYYSLVNKEKSPFESGIKRFRKNKIEEFRKICNNNIISGIQVELSDNKLHHFTMELEDQLNLLEIRNLIALGESTFIYHESGGEYKEFSKEDMKKIIDEMFKHKQKQLLLFNKLKKHINELTNLDEINNLKYNEL